MNFIKKKEQMTDSTSSEYNNIVTNLKTYNTILKKHQASSNKLL